MNARDLMGPVVTVRADQTLAEIAGSFEDVSVRAVAVVDQEGNLEGFLTDEDLLDAVLPVYVRHDESLARVLAEMEAADMLTRVERKPIGELLIASEREHEYVGPDATLLEVLSSLVESQAAAVLVVEANKPIGVITVDQLLRLILSSKSQ